MKQIFLLSLFCFYILPSKSQAPDWVWCKISNTVPGGFGEGVSIAVDEGDNVYVTGFYTGTITFDTVTFTHYTGAFLTKYDQNGNLKWADSNLGSDALGACTVVDNQGNAYMTGTFKGAVMFGSHILGSIGDWDSYLVKYDASGNVLWAQSAGGTDQDNARAVTIDAAGNLYISGDYTSPSFTIGSVTLINPGGTKNFIAKYDSSGNVIWAKTSLYGGGYGYTMATDPSTNTFIAGDFYSDSIAFGPYTLHKYGGGDIFIAKYDSAGNTLWAERAGGLGSEDAYSIATDASGNAYLAGRFKSSPMSFGSSTLTNAGDYDAYLVKYDPSGNVLFAKSIGDSLYESGWGVTTDGISKIYFTGGFTSAINFDTISLGVPLGALDPMFISAYDLSGNALFVSGVASGGDDWSSVGIAKTSPCIYLGGDFEPTILLLGNDTIISNGGNENVFVGKLCYENPTNVNEQNQDEEYILYPNPFQSNLTISVKENTETEIIIYNVLSDKIFQQNFTTLTTINTEQFPRGIYFYELKNKSKVIGTGKMIRL